MPKCLQIAYISFLFFAFIGCKQKDETENALSILVKKYPEFQTWKGKQTDYYKLIRSVTIGEKGIELQLRSAPDTITDPQSIILVINPNRKAYAIPFFSNTYYGYWNFEFDNITSSKKSVAGTFQNELNNCFEALSINDTLGTAEIVFNELFLSLLQCEILREEDSIRFQRVLLSYNNNLPEENTDSCSMRLKKNWGSIVNNFHPKKEFMFIAMNNAFWDKSNGRIYQFVIKNFDLAFYNKPHQKPQFDIKNYRQDCIQYHMKL